MHLQHDCETTSVSRDPASALPEFHKSPDTITLVKAGVAVSTFCAIACSVTGVWIVVSTNGNIIRLLKGTELASEAITLLVGLILTFGSDTLGFVHATSLRWALYREGRLEYNTNFRLFTSSRTSLANHWYMNILSTACLVLGYASLSLTLLPWTGGFNIANGMALMLLGSAIFGQIIIAALCLRQHEAHILTWSASPLTNTLAGLHGHSVLKRRPGRCMLSVTEKDAPAHPSKPAATQPRLWRLRHVKWIVVFVWMFNLVWIGCAAGMTQLLVAMEPTVDHFQFRWSNNVDWTNIVVFGLNLFYWGDSIEPPVGTFAIQGFWAILFLFVIHGVQALGLHCVELLVNMSRDEQCWQQSSRQKGAQMSSEPLLSVLNSWRTILLTSLKAVLHWTLGQSLAPQYFLSGYDDPTDDSFVFLGGIILFHISPSRLLIYCTCLTITAIYTTILALWPVHSSQPVAWGHLQTLADLVDDWETKDGRIWWGDKGSNGLIRHAGTASYPEAVDEVLMGEDYAGRANCEEKRISLCR